MIVALPFQPACSKAASEGTLVARTCATIRWTLRAERLLTVAAISRCAAPRRRNAGHV
jgi:hypothetical protein